MNPPDATFLKGDPLPWLLEEKDPSVRYWALVDLLDQPASDPQVQDAREAIADLPLVQKLIEAQNPKGYWGEDESKPYNADGTLGVLSLLYYLGVAPGERTAQACDSLLRNCQNENGGFSMVKTRRSGIFPCTTGETLAMLVYFGLGDDPRVKQAYSFQIEDLAREGSLDCGRYQHRDCLWGAIAGLRGLAAFPPDRRPAQAELTIVRLAEALLDGPYDFEGEHRRWLTFGVPRNWNLLSALLVLAEHGYAQDAHFSPLLERVMACQDDEGRWLCGSSSRTWPLEKINRPSKWVTLDAMRLIKKMGS